MKGPANKSVIDELLTRGVGEFIDPDGVFLKKLENNPEQIIIKFGIDPTKPDIHLGHAVILRKLKQFQDLGAKIVFLIGDYTAQIGDPSGRSKERPEINVEEVDSNSQTYLKQIGSILNVSDENKYKCLKNSIWYQSVTDYNADNMIEKTKLWENERAEYKLIRPDQKLPTTTLFNFMFALRHITHSQLIERDMFKKRIKSGNQLYMHEMMYPVLQGVDSEAIAGFFDACDLEVGGTDQTFNMLMGRTVMKMHNRRELQAVLAFKLLEGTDGQDKMSKSLDNYIGITDEPNNMYGKVMSIPDSSIGNYFELCTNIPLSEVEQIRKKVIDGSVNPKDLKMKLAHEIVKIYHGDKMAKGAEDNFIKTFQKKGIPEDVQEVKNGKPFEVLVVSGATASTSAARRLFEAGAVTDLTDDRKLTLEDKLEPGHVYRIGQHKFIKIKE